MRVLVCGGRDYLNRARVFEVLDEIDPDVVIEGGALGADRLANSWAKSRRVPVMTFKAKWIEGKAAGPRRNTRMLLEGKPDLVVAFPGGLGTADMVKKARAAGVEVRVFKDA